MYLNNQKATLHSNKQAPSIVMSEQVGTILSSTKQQKRHGLNTSIVRPLNNTNKQSLFIQSENHPIQTTGLRNLPAYFSLSITIEAPVK